MKLGDVLQLHRGYDLPHAKRTAGEIPVISSSGISGSHNVSKCEGPNVITGRYGTIGEVYYHDGPCWPLNTTLYVSDFKGNNPQYVYYLLKYALKELMFGDGSDKSTVPGIDRNVLHMLHVPYESSIEQQTTIVALLSSIDSKIETDSKIIAELESLARTIYDYWFTQFDFPDENGNPYRSSGGTMVHNDTLNRDIPEGWEVKPLGDLLTWERGISYTSKDLGEGVPMINLASFSPTGYSQSGIKQYKGNYQESKVLHPYDLVMCNTQQTAIDFSKDIIGHTFLVPDIFEGDIVFSHHVTHIIVNEALKYWIAALFDSDYFHRYIVGYASGTSIMGLDFNGIEKFNSPLPPISILKQYEVFMRPIYQRKSALMKESARLTSLRDWLLPLLMNGQAIIEQ
ncbi:restriction endonuclease subunit S [Bifidobacterium catulorum]|uniref:restriction endonuclease subunit S n=1 Tax=Bifidobacterium catulorum TaxID=1630173 RepID=UPI001F4EA29F|nr:restriction endonuclease subunit S [Bifidobacterium catulorum]